MKPSLRRLWLTLGLVLIILHLRGIQGKPCTNETATTDCVGPGMIGACLKEICRCKPATQRPTLTGCDPSGETLGAVRPGGDCEPREILDAAKMCLQIVGVGCDVKARKCMCRDEKREWRNELCVKKGSNTSDTASGSGIASAHPLIPPTLAATASLKLYFLLR